MCVANRSKQTMPRGKKEQAPANGIPEEPGLGFTEAVSHQLNGFELP